MNSELLKLRTKLQISQQQMADMLAISRSKYALLETGRRLLTEPVSTAVKDLMQSVSNAQAETNEVDVDTPNDVQRQIEQLRITVLKKKSEMKNLQKIRSEKMKLRAGAINTLALIEQELKTFPVGTSYHETLRDMKQNTIESLNIHSSESIEFIDIKIEVLQFIIEKYTAFAAAKNWNISSH